VRTIETESGVRIATWVSGRGPAVLLLHGWPVTSFHWRHTVPALVRAGFQAIAMDSRGLGESMATAGGYDKESLARDLLAVANTLDISTFHLIGHDWGATVAYLVSADNPDRVRSLTVEEELLPGTDAVIPPPGDTHYPSWHGAFNRESGLAESLLSERADAYHLAFLRQSAGPTGLAAEAEQVYATAYTHQDKFTAGLEYYRTGATDRRAVGERSKRPLSQPVLTIGGEFGMGTAVRDSLSAVADSVRHIQINGAGHYPAEQQPEPTNTAIVDFLRGIETPRGP